MIELIWVEFNRIFLKSNLIQYEILFIGLGDGFSQT